VGSEAAGVAAITPSANADANRMRGTVEVMEKPPVTNNDGALLHPPAESRLILALRDS
jgi:hypothetical protein